MSRSVAAVADRYVGRDGGAPVAADPGVPAPVAAVTSGHNGAPEPTPYETVRTEIEDLYLEAKNWADGEPIANQEVHDEVERLYDMLHAAGKRADEARVAEKAPVDAAAKEIQDRYNLLIGNTKSAKGKVTLGKDALGALLAPWRTRIAQEKAAAAAAARAEADRQLAAAQEAIRSSSGNLEAREEAEELLKDAQKVERGAKRAIREATTGLGLRSVWHAELQDKSAALDWAYGRDPVRFRQLVQVIADEAVRGGLRAVPGFTVREEKVAR